MKFLWAAHRNEWLFVLELLCSTRNSALFRKPFSASLLQTLSSLVSVLLIHKFLQVSLPAHNLLPLLLNFV